MSGFLAKKKWAFMENSVFFWKNKSIFADVSQNHRCLGVIALVYTRIPTKSFIMCHLELCCKDLVVHPRRAGSGSESDL